MASYEHAHALVRAHGEAGRTGRPVPLTTDGLIYVTSIVMLDSARRKVPVRALARWLLGLGSPQRLRPTWRTAWAMAWRVPQWPHGRRSHWPAPMSFLWGSLSCCATWRLNVSQKASATSQPRVVHVVVAAQSDVGGGHLPSMAVQPGRSSLSGKVRSDLSIALGNADVPGAAPIDCHAGGAARSEERRV